jgi:hypothetical protein
MGIVSSSITIANRSCEQYVAELSHLPGMLDIERAKLVHLQERTIRGALRYSLHISNILMFILCKDKVNLIEVLGNE